MKAAHISPKVSIVIPVYNGSNFMAEAIDSALAQTYQNLEVIVVNDGSTDNGATEKIAKSYGDSIRYFKKENGGVASALNLGIDKMTGEYFSWLSHDDRYEKTKIADQVDYLNNFQGDSVIVACNAKVLFPSGIKKRVRINANTFSFIDIFLATSANVGVNGCSLLIPKRAFDVCGDFNVNLPVTQDYDLWFRFKDKFRFVLLDKHLVISRRHKGQDSERKKDILRKTGDDLHCSFLETISYDRFEDYFKNSKSNVEHTYANYLIYKERGYTKTASMILINVLRFYYENDKSRFRDVFKSEIDSVADEKEYDVLMSYDPKELPLKRPTADSRPSAQPSGVRKVLSQIKDSINQVGIYLTIEAILRRVYAKLRK